MSIILILLYLLFTSPVFADGFIYTYDKDTWSLFNEEQQVCVINYKNGLQNIILTVNTGELRGEKAVWIFPVPAKPENIAIDIIKVFPILHGYDVEESAVRLISEIFRDMRWHLFPLLKPIYSGIEKGSSGMEGVTIHEIIEKMGLTTGLISSIDGISLSNYLSDKGLVLEDVSRSILDEYAGKGYSFVVSWISDIKKFKQEQGEIKKGYRQLWAGDTIGVFITFPTDKMYYPLKPTSVYGSKRVPAIIYVMGYVEPELYPEIKMYSEVNYYFQRYPMPQGKLKDFFFGQEMPKDLKYTKIKINPPSKYLTQDLWIKISTPFKVRLADFTSRFILWYGLFFFTISSILASLISGMIIFRSSIISKGKFTLFGLFNFLTIVGFGIATYFLRTKEITEDIKDYVTRNGLSIFEDQRQRHYIILIIFVSWVLLWLILGRSKMGEWLLILFSLLVFVVPVLIFNLSKEKLKKEHKDYFAKNDIKLKVFDLKKFTFLFIFNLILLSIIFSLLSDYNFQNNAAKFLGFVTNDYSDGYAGFFLFLLIFTASILILVFMDKFFKNKYGTKGFYILQEDFKKIWFVLLFVIIYIVLTNIFQVLVQVSLFSFPIKL